MSAASPVYIDSPSPSNPLEPSVSSTTASEAPDSTNSRNLVLCVDGTANEFSTQNTNVVELYRRLLHEDTKQLTYYTSGIGTFATRPSSIFGRCKLKITTLIEMVTARHFEQKIFNAYQWLSENYQIGDRIFLFGFSRGAYFVRVIAGMIERVGLLHKGNNDQIPFAFKLYVESAKKREQELENDRYSKKKREENTEVPPLTDQAENVAEKQNLSNSAYTDAPTDTTTGNGAEPSTDPYVLCSRYKQAFSRDNVKIHFIGAWDTVSSIGLIRKPTLPETCNGMEHVEYFRHALALDERRVKFIPDYANGNDARRSARTDVETTKWPDRNVQEVWFRGCHADIGGANNKSPENDRPSLRWMLSEAVSKGLKLSEVGLPKQGSKPTTHIESLAGGWWILEYLPLRRIAAGRANHCGVEGPKLSDVREPKKGSEPPTHVESLAGGWRILEYLPLRHVAAVDSANHCETVTRRIHRGSPRSVHRDQMLHTSVEEAVNRPEDENEPQYQPKARLCVGPHLPRVELRREVFDSLVIPQTAEATP